MAQKKKNIILLAVVAAILAGLIIWIVWGNTALEQNTYTVSSSNLPEAFDGYRIAHVSDLHNAEIGKHNSRLLDMLQEINPDLIAITGDLIDSRNTDLAVALQFIREAVKIAPVYYVTGNHESRTSTYLELKQEMEAAGVTVLEDSLAEITRSGSTISLIGIHDPSFQTDYLFGDAQSVVASKLAELRTDGFTVLLSHRPELFDTYAEYDMNVVLSGHAHGGQFRLPFVGGLVAPNQGVFPKYDSGLYTEGNTHMLVSRGIGNSLFPFRICNRPEVILIELKTVYKNP